MHGLCILKNQLYVLVLKAKSIEDRLKVVLVRGLNVSFCQFIKNIKTFAIPWHTDKIATVYITLNITFWILLTYWLRSFWIRRFALTGSSRTLFLLLGRSMLNFRRLRYIICLIRSSPRMFGTLTAPTSSYLISSALCLPLHKFL